MAAQSLRIALCYAFLFVLSGCGGSSSDTPEQSVVTPNPTDPGGDSGTGGEDGSGGDSGNGSGTRNTELDLIEFSPLNNGYAHFESTAIHPIRVSADGQKLYVVYTPDNRLSVFDISDPLNPELEQEIPVGLEPVSVTENPYVTGQNREVWVANVLSDSVSVVDVDAGVVVETIQGQGNNVEGTVFDEPSDVAFANGKAYVTAAISDAVYVFDASTYQELDVIEIFAKQPKSLAVSNDGSKVYVLTYRSGNGTTVLGEEMSTVPAPQTPTNPDLPAPPDVGIIVRADDPNHATDVTWSLPDNDLCEINTESDTVTNCLNAIGTINFDLAINPANNDIYVANFDSRNLVQFEPNLRGHTIDSRLTKISGSTRTITDLNNGIDYNVLPNDNAKAIALAEPTGLAIKGSRLYVAAQGTDRVGVLDLSTDTIIDRIDIGDAEGSQTDTINIRGPRGLAIHPNANALYVHNRLSDTVSVVNTDSNSVERELPIGTHDPVPEFVRQGRKFLYDAKLSGNGTNSCASCHVDGEDDYLSWDLGDPGGEMITVPAEFTQNGNGQSQNTGSFPELHPMKGPMFTQTLRGIGEHQLMHWRGDKINFQEFNPAFDGLLGGSMLSDENMDLFASWVATVVLPPNPRQHLDRTTMTPMQQEGFRAFTEEEFPAGSCSTCHVMPTTSSFKVVDFPMQEREPMEVGNMRTLYKKANANPTKTGPIKAGFGITHDGAELFVEDFVENAVAQAQQFRDPITEFLKSADSGTAPTVGHQVAADRDGVNLTDLTLLEQRATAGDIDLVITGKIAGKPVGMIFDPLSQLYKSDLADDAEKSSTDIVNGLVDDNDEIVFMGTYPGTGWRIALDRDLDGVLNGDEN